MDSLENQKLIEQLQMINGSLQSIISTINSTGQNISATVSGVSSNMITIGGVLVRMEQEHIADRIESEKENRHGKWEVDWFVEVPPRKPIRFDSDEEAYEAARHAAQTLTPGTEIKVYCTEVKRYNPEEVKEEVWRAERE